MSDEIKDRPTLTEVMTRIAKTHFIYDAEYSTSKRDLFNSFPACGSKTELLGQYNRWMGVRRELTELKEAVIEDDRAALASFKKMIKHMDEINKTIEVSQETTGMDWDLGKVESYVLRKAEKWAREGGVKETKPKPKPTKPNKEKKTEKEEVKTHTSLNAQSKKKGNCYYHVLSCMECKKGSACTFEHDEALLNSDEATIVEKVSKIKCNLIEEGGCKRQNQGKTCPFHHPDPESEE